MAREGYEGPVRVDTALDVLTNRYRRRLLVALLDHNPQDWADPEFTADDVSDDERLAIRITHVHLPKLADAGYVEWDQTGTEVRTGPRFDEIRPLLRLLHDNADDLPDDWL